MENVGCSDVVTASKQRHLSEIMNAHIGIVSKIIEKSVNQTWGAYDCYYYADLNCGPGEYAVPETGERIKGSPLVFLQAAKGKVNNVRAFLFDESQSSIDHLLAMGIEGIRGISVYHGDNRVEFGRVFREHREKIVQDRKKNLHKKNMFGLVYSDPNSATDTPFDTLAEFSRTPEFKKVDILLNISACNLKRVRKSPRTEFTDTLEQSLQKVDKKFWIIREPIGRGQWTMIIGTNWNSFPDFKHIGFHNIGSTRGKEIFNLLNYTKGEIELLPHKLVADAVDIFGGEIVSGWVEIRGAKYTNYEEYLQHPEFRKIRAEVLRRDGDSCRICKTAKASQVHHLRYPPWGKFDVPSNLISICHECHCNIHDKREIAQ